MVVLTAAVVVSAAPEAPLAKGKPLQILVEYMESLQEDTSQKEIAAQLAGAFDQMTEKKAFRLELRTDEEGIEYIYWHGLENDEQRVWTAEPYTSFWHRFGIFFMSLLPIESQL